MTDTETYQIKTYSLQEAMDQFLYDMSPDKRLFAFVVRQWVLWGLLKPHIFEPETPLFRFSHLDLLTILCVNDLLTLGIDREAFVPPHIAFEGVFDIPADLGDRPIQAYLDRHDLKVQILVMRASTAISFFPNTSLERRLADYTKGVFRNHTSVYALIDVGYWENRLYEKGCYDDRVLERSST